MNRVLFVSLLLLGCGRSGLLAFSQTGDAGQPPIVKNEPKVEDKSCPADRSEAIGKACPTEGVVCGSCSPSPCQWCNLLSCTRGHWQNIEAFPAPAEFCDFPCGGGTCDRFTEVCVERLGRDTACAVPHSCEPLPKPCVGCEAHDGGGNVLRQGCGS